VRPDPIIAQVAAKIRAARLDAGLSQVEIARRTGLDLRTVTRVEGEEREPGITTVVRIARGIGVSVSDLLDGIE
jgi:transcriptional regulator with XRE-family HTH domain